MFLGTTDVFNDVEQNESEYELTSLGDNVPEISTNMIDQIDSFYNDNDRYPRSCGDYSLF